MKAYMHYLSCQLRQQSTKAEMIIWHKLRNRQLKGYKFQRQFAIPIPYLGIGKFFVVDFYCFERNLIIEIEGEVHVTQIEKDNERFAILQNMNYRILRFTNDEVMSDLPEVLRKIKEAIE